jgi:hypothetical protein
VPVTFGTPVPPDHGTRYAVMVLPSGASAEGKPHGSAKLGLDGGLGLGCGGGGGGQPIVQVPQDEVAEKTRSPVVLLYVPVMPTMLTTMPVTAPTPPPTVHPAVVLSANQDCAEPAGATS